MNTTRSQQLFLEAQTLMPGGVNSPVRAFRSVGGEPIYMDHAAGSRMWDVDGNEFIDYVKHELSRGIGDWEQRLSTALVKSSPTNLVRSTPPASASETVLEPDQIEEPLRKVDIVSFHCKLPLEAQFRGCRPPTGPAIPGRQQVRVVSW